MKIATYNINGIRARMETVTTWLSEQAPDVALLQEIKIGAARPRYALNLFGDLSLGLASRSEGDLRRPEPAFGVGVFDMLFSADLGAKITMTTE